MEKNLKETNSIIFNLENELKHEKNSKKIVENEISIYCLDKEKTKKENEFFQADLNKKVNKKN